MDQTQEKTFMKCLDMFKKIQTNIPFIEAISHMAQYAKFLKEIVSSKKKLEEYVSVSPSPNTLYPDFIFDIYNMRHCFIIYYSCACMI